MRKIMELPSYEELHEYLSYDKETGLLTWRKSFPFQKVEGKIAGTLKQDGYINIGYKGKSYRAHRIIWKMMTGNDPENWIDHKDTNRSNNKWDNLRPATVSQNTINTGVTASNTSGVKGVYWSAASSKWRAHCTIDGKVTSLGTFATMEEAIEARRKATEKHYGEFARE